MQQALAGPSYLPNWDFVILILFYSWLWMHVTITTWAICSGLRYRLRQGRKHRRYYFRRR